MNDCPTSSTFSLADFPRSLDAARVALPPQEFRSLLRQHLLAHPNVTLQQIAFALGVSRQRVHLLVGALHRPTCAHPGPHPAPKTEQARTHMAELVEKVRAGEPAEQAAKDLGISLTQATKLGFRVKKFRPAHGTRLRAAGDEGRPPCNCWRCRRALGVALPRGPKSGPVKKAKVLDWLAYRDPDTGEGLKQAEIGRLSGVGQGAVSRIAREAAQ